MLLTSHYLDEVEQLADRVGVMRRGRMIAEGSPGELTAATGRYDGAVPIARPGSKPATSPRLLDGDATARGQAGRSGRHDAVRRRRRCTPLTGWALERGHELDRLVVQRPSLEDLFLALAGDDER